MRVDIANNTETVWEDPRFFFSGCFRSSGLWRAGLESRRCVWFQLHRWNITAKLVMLLEQPFFWCRKSQLNPIKSHSSPKKQELPKWQCFSLRHSWRLCWIRSNASLWRSTWWPHHSQQRRQLRPLTVSMCPISTPHCTPCCCPRLYIHSHSIYIYIYINSLYILYIYT